MHRSLCCATILLCVHETLLRLHKLAIPFTFADFCWITSQCLCFCFYFLLCCCALLCFVSFFFLICLFAVASADIGMGYCLRSLSLLTKFENCQRSTYCTQNEDRAMENSYCHSRQERIENPIKHRRRRQKKFVQINTTPTIQNNAYPASAHQL